MENNNIDVHRQHLSFCMFFLTYVIYNCVYICAFVNYSDHICSAIYRHHFIRRFYSVIR